MVMQSSSSTAAIFFRRDIIALTTFWVSLLLLLHLDCPTEAANLWAGGLSVAHLGPLNISSFGTTRITAGLNATSCPKEVGTSAAALLLVPAVQNDQNVSVNGNISVDCSSIAFDITPTKQRPAKFHSAIQISDAQNTYTIPSRPYVITVLEAPAAQFSTSEVTWPCNNATIALAVTLSGTTSLESSVGISLSDENIAQVVGDQILTWQAGEAGTKWFYVKLVQIPASGYVFASLIPFKHVHVDPGGAAKLVVTMPVFSYIGNKAVYVGNTSETGTISINVTASGCNPFPSVLYYQAFLVEPQAGSNVSAVSQSPAVQAGGLIAQTSSPGPVLIQLPMSLFDMANRTELHIGLTLTAVANAAVAPQNNTIAVFLFSVPLGQCPAGTCLMAGADAADQRAASALAAGVPGALAGLQLSAYSDSWRQWFQTDPSPPFSPSIFSYWVVVPYKPTTNLLLFQRVQMNDIVLVGWTDCAGASTLVQQVGGPLSLSVGLDISRQNVSCSLIAIVLGQASGTPPASEQGSPVPRPPLAGQPPQPIMDSGTLANAAAAARNATANITNSTVMPSVVQLDAAADQAAQAADKAVAGSKGRKLDQSQPPSQASNGRGSGTPAASLQHYTKAYYNITILPLSDPASLEMQALSYTGAPNSVNTLLVLCGLPLALSAALGFPDPSQMSYSARQLLTQAIVGSPSSAADDLQAQLGVPINSSSGQVLGLAAPADGTAALTVLVNPYYSQNCSTEQYILVHAPLLQQLMPQANLTYEAAGPDVKVDAGGNFVTSLTAAQLAVLLQSNSGIEDNDSNADAQQDAGNTKCHSATVAGAVGFAGIQNATAEPCEELVNALPPGVAEMPIIVQAADHMSSATYALLLFSNPSSIANLSSLAVTSSNYTVVEDVNQVQGSNETLNQVLQAKLFGARNSSWPPSPVESCFICPAGSFTSSKNSASCQLCPPGQFSGLPLSSQCTRCPPGTFTFSWGSVLCRACIMGTYSNVSGARYCSICPEGFTNVQQGSNECPLDLRYASQSQIPGIQFEVVLTFNVVLTAPSGSVQGLSVETTGIDGSAINILRILIQADAADALNVPMSAIKLSTVEHTSADTFLVSVMATAPLTVAAKDSMANPVASNDMNAAELQADALVQQLASNPDAFPRTSQATGGSVQVADVGHKVLRVEDSSSGVNINAIVWPSVIGGLLLGLGLGLAWMHNKRRPVPMCCCLRRSWPSADAREYTRWPSDLGVSRQPSDASGPDHSELQLQELHSLPNGTIAARFRIKTGSRVNLEASGDANVDHIIANPAFIAAPR